jgi:tetratricopeptide (TPR) repeat protein/transcriptional regulator with XRE-family HTH domain
MGAVQPLTFGLLLKQHRRSTALTQEALAARVGYSPSYISQLERGERLPGRATVQVLAAALALTEGERATLLATVRAEQRHTTRAPTLRATTSPPLIGRLRELVLLEQHLAGTGPPVLLLSGEPGIGKSRLLREAAARAAQHGLSVLLGGCHQRHGQEPYAPLLAALESRVRAQPRARLQADLQGCAWLVRLLPELAETTLVPVPDWSLPPDQERRLMFAAAGRFLANVAGEGGTLLLLDDLQWASADALDLLASLVRMAGERPLRVLGAYRSTEVHGPHPLATALADLARDGLVTETALGPLAADEATLLLDGLWTHGSEASHDLRRGVLRRAGGVPFFLVSCAQAMQMGSAPTAGTDKTETGEGRAETIPWDVAQTVRQRVVALPEPARELLAVAAVAGRVLPADMLLAVVGNLGQSRWQALGAAEACCRAGLLVEHDRARYSFAHDLIHEVVAADLSAGRAAALHQEVAAALERRPGEPPIEQLAYHYARAGNQEKAVLYLEQAGDRASTLCAHAEAQVHYQDLVLCLDTLGRDLNAARAREKLSDVLIVLGRYDDALRMLEPAAHTYRERGDVEGTASTLGRIAYAHARAGTARDWLVQAEPMHEAERLAVAAGRASRGVALLYANLAPAFSNSGRYTEALDAACRSVELARVVGDETIRASAMVPQGLALKALGRGREARAVFEETVVLAERLGDFASSARAQMNLGALCDALGDFAAARPWYERAATAATRFGDAPLECLVLSTWSDSAYLSGDWPWARALAERAAAALQSVGRSYAAPSASIVQGQLDLAQGDREAAASVLGEVVRLATAAGIRGALIRSQALLAECDLLADHPGAACKRLAPLLDPLDPHDIAVTRALPLLAWAYRDLGEIDRAEALAQQAIALAIRQEQRLALVDAQLISALIASRMGRRPEATTLLEEALTLTRAMPCPYAQAKALYMDGLLYRESGELARAHERFAEALAICAGLGERLYAMLMEQTMETLFT